MSGSIGNYGEFIEEPVTGEADEDIDSERVHLIRDSLKAVQLAETSFDKLLSNASSSAGQQDNSSQVQQ